MKKRKKTFNFSLTSIVSKCVTAKAVGCTIFFSKKKRYFTRFKVFPSHKELKLVLFPTYQNAHRYLRRLWMGS